MNIDKSQLWQRVRRKPIQGIRHTVYHLNHLHLRGYLRQDGLQVAHSRLLILYNQCFHSLFDLCRKGSVTWK